MGKGLVKPNICQVTTISCGILGHSCCEGQLRSVFLTFYGKRITLLTHPPFESFASGSLSKMLLTRKIGAEHPPFRKHCRHELFEDFFTEALRDAVAMPC